MNAKIYTKGSKFLGHVVTDVKDISVETDFLVIEKEGKRNHKIQFLLTEVFYFETYDTVED